MKKTNYYSPPTYVISDASGYYSASDKKDRFCIKYTYLFADRLITIKKQSNGKFEEDNEYYEFFTN